MNLVTLTPKELDHLLLVATIRKNLEVCQFLLKKNANPFRKFLLGITAYSKAVNENHFQIVRLIKWHHQGIKVNFTERQIERLIRFHPLIYSHFLEKGGIIAKQEHLIEAIEEENAYLVNILINKVPITNRILTEAQNNFPMILSMLKKHQKK